MIEEFESQRFAWETWNRSTSLHSHRHVSELYSVHLFDGNSCVFSLLGRSVLNPPFKDKMNDNSDVIVIVIVIVIVTVIVTVIVIVIVIVIL